MDFHPSNRLRYSFLLQPLPPSNYKISLAFGVSGSNYSYIFVESDFSVFPRETLYNEMHSGPREHHSTEHFSNEVISAESRFQENTSKEIPIIINSPSADTSKPLPQPLSLSEPNLSSPSQEDHSQTIAKDTQGNNQSTVTDLPTWNDLSGLHDEDSEFAFVSSTQKQSSTQNQRNIFTEEKTKELQQSDLVDDPYNHSNQIRSEDRNSQQTYRQSNNEKTVERKGESGAKKTVTRNAKQRPQEPSKEQLQNREQKTKQRTENAKSSTDMLEDEVFRPDSSTDRRKKSRRSSSSTSKERASKKNTGKKRPKKAKKRMLGKNREREKKERKKKKEAQRKSSSSQSASKSVDKRQTQTSSKKHTKSQRQVTTFSEPQTRTRISEQEISEQDISQFEDSYYDGPNKFDVGWNPPKKDSFEEKNKRSKRSSSASKYQEEEYSDDWTQGHIDEQPNIFQIITQTLLNPTQDPFIRSLFTGFLLYFS